MVKFAKMTGCGNDFILIDAINQQLPFNNLSKIAKKLCHRTLSLGADGAIIIEPSERADFKWRFYNSDGSEAEMCGNGGRCAARFAYMRKIAGKKMSFETKAGIIKAELNGIDVKVQLTKPDNIKKDIRLNVLKKPVLMHFINTGVPHTVIFVNDIEKCDVEKIGRNIRFHREFEPAGTNVNFVNPPKKNLINVRTYERGVEAETLACGTGAAASAIFHILMNRGVSPVSVKTRGGEVLKVFVEMDGDNVVNVFLQGGARVICEGELKTEAWEY